MENIAIIEQIENKIHVFREKKIILDKDLAFLYKVAAKRLNEQVKRNIKRFPLDFMFQLSAGEAKQLLNSRSQIATLKQGQNIKYLPFAFTEQGVAMLSSILNSEKAIQVNIMIMRAFTQLNKYLLTHRNLREKIEAMESKYDRQFKIVFDAIKALISPAAAKKPKIGFVRDKE